MTTVLTDVSAAPAAIEEFATKPAFNPAVSVWNVATIAAITRDVAKLEVKLADVDPAGHSAAKQLEDDIDAMILSATEQFAFNTSEIFKLQVQTAALKRYAMTRSTSDLRAAYGTSRVVYIHDGIEEDSTPLAA